MWTKQYAIEALTVIVGEAQDRIPINDATKRKRDGDDEPSPPHKIPRSDDARQDASTHPGNDEPLVPCSANTDPLPPSTSDAAAVRTGDR